MRTMRTVAELRAALAEPRRHGRTVALVPTMGYLHDGHLALIRAARAEADVVVVSLFVNPAQFDDASDLAAYPRDEQRDAGLAQEAGADLLFAPPVEEVYPPGFTSQVRVGGALTETLEGAHRGAEHFHGVTTVVTKLLNMVGPDVAYFGQKDAQQALVIRRLATDLDLPARIEVVPTVREPDGLALSSRNVRLSAPDRERALALSAALRAAEAALAGGSRDATELTAAARAAMEPFDVEPEYLALVDPADLQPVRTVDQDALLAVAARVGPVRLIDNTILAPADGRADGGR
jgi:pantoate--beta-alanine ligase